MTRFVSIVLTLAVSATAFGGDVDSATEVARQVDQLILKELTANDVKPTALSSDEDFLRRATFDIAGTLPSARDVTLFGLNPSADKREKTIDKLLKSDEYAETWARYWRDVLFSRATNMRAPFVNRPFTEWMTESLKENMGWHEIATRMLTSSGDIRENGETALFFVQEGSPEDIAGEVSRIFLGIQIQCANCHNHPWDRWKREQFHELAAFFPRVGIRPIREDNMLRSYEIVSVDTRVDNRDRAQFLKQNAERMFRFSDRNRDGKLVKSEIQRNQQLARNFDRLLAVGDKNKDGGLSLTEFRELPTPPQNQPGRGSAEHYMADLNDPSSRGEKIDPKFFVTGYSPKSGLEDMERRELFSKYLTSTKNEWFSRAFVNRMWAEMTGEGFHSPIDDMGPDRSASFPDVFELLAGQFIDHDYDIQWLMRTIALTDAYQREVRSGTESEASMPFACATPTRLRGDQLYSAILTTLGGNTAQPRGRGQTMTGGPYRRAASPRDQFGQLFGFDPSTPQADITGNIPQALFMMNSPLLNNQIKASGFTRLSGLLKRFSDNEDAISELYLMVLAREPSRKELGIFNDYIAEVGDRNEAFEDLMWSLMNSSEFLSKR